MGEIVDVEIGKESAGVVSPFFILLPRDLETDGYEIKDELLVVDLME